VPGYQAVGRIEAVGDAVDGLQVGDRVCLRRSRLPDEFAGSWMGSHLATLVVDAQDAVRIEIPLAGEQAVFSSLAAVALRGYRMLRTQPGDTAIVLGQGVLGQFSAQILRMHGVQVFTADLAPVRQRFSARYSADRAVVGTHRDLLDGLGEQVKRGVDIAVDTTGHAQAINWCVECIRPRGQILVQGWYPEPHQVDGHRAHHKEPAMYFPCSQYPHEQRECLAWLSSGRLHAAELITQRANPREAANVYGVLDRNPASCLGVVFVWDNA
jgi:3-hydroxyethyl bacteriochlorophyllide a dehydrogenase